MSPHSTKTTLSSTLASSSGVVNDAGQADGSQTSERQTPVEKARTVAFHTLGCRANQLETSTLAESFAERGWQMESFDEPADVYVINTCTVTERADQESRRMIRRAKLSNPNARIAVTGCYAQVSPEELAAQDGVSWVVGNNYKDELPALVDASPALPCHWMPPKLPCLWSRCRISTKAGLWLVRPRRQSTARGEA